MVQPIGKPRRCGESFHGRRARCVTLRWLGNRGNNCLGTHDAHYVVACHYHHGNHNHVVHYGDVCQSSAATRLLAEAHYSFNHQDQISEELREEKRCRLHLRVHSLPRGGPGGHCQYPADRYPRVQASSQDKRQSVHPRAATCPAALDQASLLRQALTLPHIPWLQTSPLHIGGVRRCHTSRGSEPHSASEVGSGADACLWLRISPLCLRRLWCCHASMALYAVEIKKVLAALGMQ
jgi:hypothetical protein